METPRRRLVAAAPPWVAAALDGSPRSAPVVHRGIDAVYVDLDGVVLGVLSATAALVPCGLRTALPRLEPEVVAADRAEVGAGRLRLGDTDVVVTRRLDPTVRPVPETALVGAATRLADAVGDRLDPVRDELPPTALTALSRGDAAAVPALLGRGSGLTPVGDDVLCGWLAVTAGTPGEVADAVRRLAAPSTTALSATLLGCAVRGEVLPEFRALLLDLADPAGPALAGPVDALLRVGHTSGAGLLLGALIALHHLASRSPTR